MNWQLLAVALIVGAAGVYLGRATWRTWSARKGGCGGSCGCKTTPAETNGQATLIPAEQVTLRPRDTNKP